MKSNWNREKKGKIWDIWQMNKELSSLNHNEPVSIYRRGEGGRERGRGEGDHVVLKGNRGGINRLEQSLMVDCGKLTSNGVGGGGDGLLEYSRTLWEGFGKFHFIILSFLGIITFLSYWAVGDWSVEGSGFEYMVCINLISSVIYGMVVNYSPQWRKLAVDI